MYLFFFLTKLALLKKYEVNEKTEYATIKEKISTDEAFTIIKEDSERVRIFNDYIMQIKETCLHHIKKKKEKRRKSKRSRSKSESPSGAIPSDEEEQIDEVPIRQSKKESNGSSNTSSKKEDKPDEEEKVDGHSKSGKKHKKSKRRKRQKSVSIFFWFVKIR